jgi:biopolymer transport protein TolR
MAFDVSSKTGVRGQVNITPLIDVVLVLLIIFMVMSPTTMKHLKPQAVQDSPQAAPGGPQPVLIEVTTTGVAVNGVQTPWLALAERVRERLAASHQSAVVFKIADEVEYGEAVRILDLCRGAGAQILALPRG